MRRCNLLPPLCYRRDRDKLREQGSARTWLEIVRIWSTDWWVNPGGTRWAYYAALTELLEKTQNGEPTKPWSYPRQSPSRMTQM